MGRFEGTPTPFASTKRTTAFGGAELKGSPGRATSKALAAAIERKYWGCTDHVICLARDRTCIAQEIAHPSYTPSAPEAPGVQ